MVMEAEERDPYNGIDPGTGLQQFLAHKFDIDKDMNLWKLWRTNDGRVLPNRDSTFERIDNPFGGGSLILLSTYFDPSVTGKSFGGFGMRAPISPPLVLNDQTFLEFDLYYPGSAAGKYMRFEFWSTSTGGEGFQANSGFPGDKKTQIYIRTSELEMVNNLIPDWIGFYNGETWYKNSFFAAAPVSNGNWEYLNIDLHTETGTKVNGDLLFIGNIRFTQKDNSGMPIPLVVNTKGFSEVEPVKKKYNPGNGYFLVGTVGTGPVSTDKIRGYHFGIFVGENNLKPECHVSAPKWLRELFPGFKFKTDYEELEWKLPTSDYLALRDAGEPGQYKIHGHCLAWINQSPPWMRQIIPENISSMHWNPNGLFYTGANNAAGPFLKVKKETARRIYFDHILYLMRHFMSKDARYGSSKERGIIPFHSFDVLNVEIHESRHGRIINDNPDEWKSALKHVSWLMAMTDNDADDVTQHYIYLLYKFAHIAVPNAQMAERYKAGYNDPAIVPEYMKLDNHDNGGSIDAYINEKPPILVYNEYDIITSTKMKAACNMIKEINTVWRLDPLYDGRNLIECIGIQGHEIVSPVLISQSLRSVSLFAGLIDDGFLDSLCYSELDIKQPDTAPGGGANAPEILNIKQADVIGYQYALFFKLFEKYKKYIDHVIFWSQYGASWLNSYVLFDQEKKASQAYYAVMDPDKFIQGHSYLDSFFSGEYEKVKGSI